MTISEGFTTIGFEPFPKIARLFRECSVTEKIDGTNAQVFITDDGEVIAGSRSRIITPADDNFGFAAWVADHRLDLLKLGPGRHFGEWWGAGIQRRYGLNEKRFSLFNRARWAEAADRPECCHVVPELYAGPFSTEAIARSVSTLRDGGSAASPGFMKPEGVIVWHTAARLMFKVTCEKDETPKGMCS